MTGIRLLLICGSILVAAPTVGYAQDAPAAPNAAPDCVVKPQDGSGANAALPDTQPLGEKLDDCNGVLKPAPIGDGEIVEPAPDTGITPVIPPGNLPEQPPSQG